MLTALLAGCSPSSMAIVDAAESGGNPAGFWLGLWHGFTLLFTFIISLFSDSVGVYEAHNSGNWYNFGFVLGAMIFFGGCGRNCGMGGKKKKAC